MMMKMTVLVPGWGFRGCLYICSHVFIHVKAGAQCNYGLCSPLTVVWKRFQYIKEKAQGITSCLLWWAHNGQWMMSRKCELLQFQFARPIPLSKSLFVFLFCCISVFLWFWKARWEVRCQFEYARPIPFPSLSLPRQDAGMRRLLHIKCIFYFCIFVFSNGEMGGAKTRCYAAVAFKMHFCFLVWFLYFLYFCIAQWRDGIRRCQAKMVLCSSCI